MLNERELIEHDIRSTKRLIQKEVLSTHRLLADQNVNIDALPAATLLFVSASMGTYDPQRWVPVGVGLELLRLAVDMHYMNNTFRDSEERNINLVTSDFFYAEAIKRASVLGNAGIIVSMVRTIIDIASAEAVLVRVSSMEQTVVDEAERKLSSLYYAAVNIGFNSGHVSPAYESNKKIMHKIANLMSAMYYSNSHANSGLHRADSDSYYKTISVLPEIQHSILKGLI